MIRIVKVWAENTAEGSKQLRMTVEFYGTSQGTSQRLARQMEYGGGINVFGFGFSFYKCEHADNLSRCELFADEFPQTKDGLESLGESIEALSMFFDHAMGAAVPHGG